MGQYGGGVDRSILTLRFDSRAARVGAAESLPKSAAAQHAPIESTGAAAHQFNPMRPAPIPMQCIRGPDRGESNGEVTAPAPGKPTEETGRLEAFSFPTRQPQPSNQGPKGRRCPKRPPPAPIGLGKNGSWVSARVAG